MIYQNGGMPAAYARQLALAQTSGVFGQQQPAYAPQQQMVNPNSFNPVGGAYISPRPAAGSDGYSQKMLDKVRRSNGMPQPFYPAAPRQAGVVDPRQMLAQSLFQGYGR